MPRKRAAPIAAPGAARITFTGIMAAPDDFGRLRVLLESDWAAPLVDHSASRLDIACRQAARRLCAQATIAENGEAAEVEITLAYAEAGGRCGASAQALLTVPARHSAHWLATAADLRGRPVRVEATIRTYQFTAVLAAGTASTVGTVSTASAAGAAGAASATRTGVALDLADLKPASTPFD